MACPFTLKGIKKECGKNNMGGIKKVWVADYSTVTTAPTLEPETNIISAVTGTFFEYEFRKMTGSLQSTFNTDDVNGITYFTNQVTLKFSKLEAAKRAEILAMAYGDCAVIVQDQNNKYWYIGFDNAVTMESGTAGTGTNFTDFNGYDIVLSDMSRELPYEVSQSAIDKITTPVA